VHASLKSAINEDNIPTISTSTSNKTGTEKKPEVPYCSVENFTFIQFRV